MNFSKWQDVRGEIVSGLGGEKAVSEARQRNIEAVARYVEAIGGQIQISAIFGDDHYVLRGTATEAA